MGKKSKNKKQKKAVAQARPQVVTSNPVLSSPALGAAPFQPSPAGSLRMESPQAKPSLTAIPEEYLRRDIVRIISILGILAVLLIGLTVINHKTTVLSRAARQVSTFLRLQ